MHLLFRGAYVNKKMGGGNRKVMDEFADCGNGACKRTCICKANGESALLGVVILP